MSLFCDSESRLLLTGGTGFVGKSILRFLLHDLNLPGVHISVISRNPHRFLSSYSEFLGDSRLSFLRADIQDRDSLPWTHSFTHVIHAAADVATLSSQSPLKCYDQIVDGTRNILDLALMTGANRFLLTSSGAVYGVQPVDLAAIPEDWSGSPPLADPSSAYGQAKRSAEHICALIGSQNALETVVARCFAFVGPDLPLDAHFAIGNFVRDALSSNSITVAGDGTPLRTYLHQADLAHWLITLLDRGVDGQAYNVGSDEVISIFDLAHLVRDILSPGKNVEILGRPATGASRNKYLPDITKVREQFNLSVSINLAEAIRQFLPC